MTPYIKKMLFCMIIPFPLMASFFASPLMAEIYKYHDENGVVCFTDDLTMVPEKQRPTTQIIKELKSAPTAVETPSGKPMEMNPASPNNKSIAELEKEREVLKEIQQSLDAEFLVLKTRREALLVQQSTRMSETEKSEFQRNVDELNTDTLSFNKKKEDYYSRVKAFNMDFNAARF